MQTTFDRAQLVRWGVALSTFIVATISLLYGPSRLEYPASFTITHASAALDSIILAATFYVSIGLILARRTAWKTGVIIMIVAAVWESIEARTTVSPLSIFPLIGLLVLLGTHDYYRIDTHHDVAARTLRRALLFTSVTTALGCLAIYLLATIEHRPFSFIPTIVAAFDHMYSLQETFRPMQYPTFSHILGRILLFGFGIMNYTVIALALLRPVADTFQLTPLAHARALHLLQRFGMSSEDYFKVFPADKSYYFGQDVEGMVVYGLREGICVALADPIAGSFQERRQLLDEFLAFTKTNGWQTVFLAVEDSQLPLYEHLGLHDLKIGEAAHVALPRLPELLKSKNNRNVMNRFSKAGFTATLTNPHHSPALLHELRAVSDAWLADSKHSERRFAMGYFDTDYLQQCRLFIVRDAEQRLIAFANLQPNFTRGTRGSIDLMRALPDAPTNTMDFLFLSLMSQMRTEGWHEFDLGLAPLSGLAKGQASERGLHIIAQYTGRWFSFRGLRRFKDKFKPTWRPVYILYTGTPSRLPAIGVAINDLMKYRD